MSLVSDNRLRALLFVLLAVGFASSQDAIVKYMSGSYPAYETVFIRGLITIPILAIWLRRDLSFASLATPMLKFVLLRGLILCSAYFAFILAIAAMPIANAVSIYFTMPFFVAGLVGWALGEHVPLYRWAAIIIGFIGVIIMVRPGASDFEPASFFALYSAFGYALGQMMSRRLSQSVSPIIIANWQNLIYFVVAIVVGAVVYFGGFMGQGGHSIAFLTRPPVWPSAKDASLLGLMGLLSAIVMMLYLNAYKSAEANFVAPFEYTAMIWAVLYGVEVFGDFPDKWTWTGAAIVVGAGLLMLWQDHKQKFRLAQFQEV
jgi:drug/metabolite transporter (DMT)-like permease